MYIDIARATDTFLSSLIDFNTAFALLAKESPYTVDKRLISALSEIVSSMSLDVVIKSKVFSFIINNLFSVVVAVLQAFCNTAKVDYTDSIIILTVLY